MWKRAASIIRSFSQALGRYRILFSSFFNVMLPTLIQSGPATVCGVTGSLCVSSVTVCGVTGFIGVSSVTICGVTIFRDGMWRHRVSWSISRVYLLVRVPQGCNQNHLVLVVFYLLYFSCLRHTLLQKNIAL